MYYILLISLLFQIFRRKRFKLGGTDRDTLEEELAALSNLSRVMATQPAPPPPPPISLPPVLPPMLQGVPHRLGFPHQGGNPMLPPTPNMDYPIRPIDFFANRFANNVHTQQHPQQTPPQSTTPPSCTATTPTPTSQKPRKKAGFTIDSLIDKTEDSNSVAESAEESSEIREINENNENLVMKPSPMLPLPPHLMARAAAAAAGAWPPPFDFHAPTSGGAPGSIPHPPPGLPPLLLGFQQQAAANFHMAAMAALAASQHHNQQHQSVQANNHTSPSPSDTSSQRPFLEVPREESPVQGIPSHSLQAGNAFNSQSQMSPTARSDISTSSRSSSASSSFNSLNGDPCYTTNSPVNLTSFSELQKYQKILESRNQEIQKSGVIQKFGLHHPHIQQHAASYHLK